MLSGGEGRGAVSWGLGGKSPAAVLRGLGEGGGWPERQLLPLLFSSQGEPGEGSMNWRVYRPRESKGKVVLGRL